MWLPLALADMMAMLAAIARRAGGDMGELKLPKRSELLKSWALPVMGAALKEDEDEQAAFEFLKSVEKLSRT